MTDRVRIVGTYTSPYVRKVLACLHLKGIEYEVDPIVPFMGDEGFSNLSPLRRIPVLLDGEVILCDSTVICEYLEDAYPAPALYPRTAVARARARWLEEYADTRMGEVLIWGLFNQRVINPRVWGVETDPAELERITERDIPQVLDYLEREVPVAGFLFGPVGVADVAIATFFRNAAFARFAVDADRWPRTAAFVERVLDLDCLERLRPFEDLLMRTPPPQQREALLQAGAPVCAETVGGAAPRRGMMRI